jgi:hypothetical protein
MALPYHRALFHVFRWIDAGTMLEAFVSNGHKRSQSPRSMICRGD